MPGAHAPDVIHRDVAVILQEQPVGADAHVVGVGTPEGDVSAQHAA